MDLFGIGQAINGAVMIYFQSARATGRTTMMLEMLKNGDRIVFYNSREADRVKRLLRERNLNVECIIAPPDNLDRLFEHGTSQGRTVFDHTWIERFWLRQIKLTTKDIDFMQERLSGYGEPHRKTARSAAEIAKWQL